MYISVRLNGQMDIQGGLLSCIQAGQIFQAIKKPRFLEYNLFISFVLKIGCSDQFSWIIAYYYPISFLIIIAS